MPVVRRTILATVAALVLWASPGCEHEPDPIGNSPDAAGAQDGAVNLPDAGPVFPCHDAGIADAGLEDAGIDGGMMDGGVGPDAGVPDGGIEPDGGLPPCPDAG